MDGEDVGIEQARKILGDLAWAAHEKGRITYLTHYGRRIAAIVPAENSQQQEDQ